MRSVNAAQRMTGGAWPMMAAPIAPACQRVHRIYADFEGAAVSKWYPTIITMIMAPRPLTTVISCSSAFSGIVGTVKLGLLV